MLLLVDFVVFQSYYPYYLNICDASVMISSIVIYDIYIHTASLMYYIYKYMIWRYSKTLLLMSMLHIHFILITACDSATVWALKTWNYYLEKSFTHKIPFWLYLMDWSLASIGGHRYSSIPLRWSFISTFFFFFFFG